MKAQLLRSYGESSSFELSDTKKPSCKEGYVLIKVKATSINPIDVKIKMFGIPVIAPKLPWVLHGDVCGVIEDIGSNVSGFKVGDEVYGCAGGFYNETGALAEYMLADAKLIAPKPKSISFAKAAALPLVSITSYESLMDKDIQEGDDVLIHGGCGGVGHIGIQMAKILKARVHTTVSTMQKKHIAKELGADEVILYKNESVSEYVKRLTAGLGFDLVLDTVGADNLIRSFEAVKIMGKIVAVIAYGSVVDLTILHAKAATLYTTFMLLPMYTGKNRESHGQILRQLSTWVDSGQIKPLIDSEFDFKDANKAHDYFREGKHIGKVIINVS